MMNFIVLKNYILRTFILLQLRVDKLRDVKELKGIYESKIYTYECGRDLFYANVLLFS
jgi:hypothetical protein